LLRNAGQSCDRRSRDETPAWQLRSTLDRDCIAQAFQGFDSPLPLACLLFRIPLLVPGLLITGPRSEEMVDEHEYFVGDGQRGLFLADPSFKPTKGAAQEGGGFPGAPGTLHQDPAEGAIRSCTRRLRIIISSRKPGKMPPSHHA
jgi:hypothetical protein